MMRIKSVVITGSWLAVFLWLPEICSVAAPVAVKTIPQSEWNPGGVVSVPEKLFPHGEGITSLVLHHTQTPNEAPVMEKARLRSIRRYHMVEREWGEVAYHYFVGSSGQIYEGRDWRFAGDSGTQYELNGRLLICLLGDFSKAMPTEEAIDSLLRLVAAKLHEHSLAPSDVVTHQMVASTDCPGAAMQMWFEEEGKLAIARVFGGEEVKHDDDEKVVIPKVTPSEVEENCVPVAVP